MDLNITHKHRTLTYLVVANFMFYIGFSIWQTSINNFAVEDLGIGALDVGWMQSFREIPGLMGFLLAFIAIYLSEVRIMALSVILLGGGISLSGQANDLPFLLMSVLVMSFGFHMFYASSDAVVLMAVDKENSPKTFGQLSSLGAIAALFASALVYFLAEPLGFRTLFMITGGFVVLGGFLLLPLGRAQKAMTSRHKITFRKKYWLFYALSFLMGSRRHIFTTFAIFLLVQKHGISVQTTAILFFVNSVLNVFAYQFIGRMVGRLGERLMLSIAFGLLIFIFLGYAFVTSLIVLFVFFVVDNLLFGFNLALMTYFQKIAVSQEEITSNVAVEQTINHISAVIVPIIGGAAWELFGSQTPFLVGVGIVAVSFVLVQFMKVPDITPSLAEAALIES
ncbi:MAG: MFS transporter [Anaerolineales bacterium]